ncbi:golgin candidate 6 isoform X2 [Helianthus annuus]|uniref:golgin candidate 6 isoform X2 n=1 Tax=Helianthus annuus TaxID=4232 RepID=UPI000B90501D|nr:golgin candidate 6 isoform X2 [Helianthus annuus]XP_022025866.1 golgin candidate 6 isoform X2 [Helianthus annuus]
MLWLSSSPLLQKVMLLSWLLEKWVCTGFPVLLGVLRERDDDVEMVRGALETLVSALTPIAHPKLHANEVQPALMNADLLSREGQSISLLLGLLEEDDFYIRYYTLQLLTALLTNSPNRLQEAILAIPRGITRLMDMLMDREVIRNEALLLLTYLTREAEEIQKILVFEGAFEKIFSIIKEEGGSEGGVVVQDCLELLNNLLRNNSSNQVLLRETIGFDSLISILKLRGTTYSFTQQKTINLLSVLETIRLLLNGDSNTNILTNKTILVQRKVLDYLLMLGVESQWAPVSVRCLVFHCIGDLISGHRQSLDALASKSLGDGSEVEPALNSILRIILRTSSMQEFIAADYVFKSFCEHNSDGQKMLASTLIPHPMSITNARFEEDVNMSFGSMLLHGLAMSEHDGDLEISSRAASILSHVMKDNIQCKEKVLQIKLESSMPSLESAEPLLHRMVKYLALASSRKGKEEKSTTPRSSYFQPIILKLLVTWLYDCPKAVQSFLDSRPHLTYLIELVSDNESTVCARGLAAVVLGECVIYNKIVESGKDAFAIVDTISQKVGLTSYFLRLDEMQKSFLFSSEKSTQPQPRKPLTRSNANSMAEMEDIDDNELTDNRNDDHPMLASMFDSQFVNFIKSLEGGIRDSIVQIYSHPKSNVSVVPAELEQKKDENDRDYIKRLKLFVEKQCSEIQDLLNRNATLAEDLANTGGGGSAETKPRSNNGSERVQIETLRRDLQEVSQRLEMFKTENSNIQNEALSYKNLAEKMETDLKSLSDAYNSLEQANYSLEMEVRALKSGGATLGPDIEKIKAEAREEAQKESEGELGDLLVCLGQEQSKVEKLSARLVELGEDVDVLLEGIGEDETGLLDDDDDED